MGMTVVLRSSDPLSHWLLLRMGCGVVENASTYIHTVRDNPSTAFTYLRGTHFKVRDKRIHLQFEQLRLHLVR